MAKSITYLAISAPPAARQHHPAAVAATAINTAISATCHPPPGAQKEGPAAGGADRAWGTADAENHEPLTEASAASVGQSRHLAALAFPATKSEATAAARLALAGWALQRADLTDHGAGYIATRWGRSIEVMADLAAVAAFADHLAGRTDGGGAT